MLLEPALLKPLKAALVIALLLGLFLFTVLILLPLFLLNLIPRTVVWALARTYRPYLGPFVTGDAALFARDESRTYNLMGLALLKGNIGLESFHEHAQRLVDYRDPETGEFSYFKLKETWEPYLGYAFWRKDGNFDLRNHARRYDYKGRKLVLPNICTESDITRAFEGLLEEPWVKGRSPWEALLINDVIIGEDGEVGSAVIFRYDHVLLDGYSGLLMAKIFYHADFVLPKSKLVDRRFSILEKVALSFRAPYDLLENSLSLIGTKAFSWREYQRDREALLTSVSPPVDVGKIKIIKNHFGVSYAAVVYAAIFSAVEKAAITSDQDPPSKIGTAIVLPRLGHPMKGLVVHATGLPCRFTVKAKTPTERLYRIKGEMDGLSRSTGSLFVPFGSWYQAYFPTIVRKVLADLYLSQGITVGISVLPTADSVQCNGEYKISKMICGAGTLAPIGIFVSTFGGNGEQIFSFSVNRSVFKSQSAARNLGMFAAQEIQSLWESIENS